MAGFACLVFKVVESGVDSWGYCGATDWGKSGPSYDEISHCSLPSSARMASVELSVG